MLKLGLYLIALLFGVSLSGCSVIETPDTLSLSKVIDRKGVISLPVTQTVLGLYTVNADVRTEDGTVWTGPFIIDTGATKTAIYRNTLSRFGLSVSDESTVKIHGMVDSGERPRVELPLLTLGGALYPNLDVAVLENRIMDPDEPSQPPFGIFGLDILSDYRLYYDADTAMLSFIPNNLNSPIIPTNWKRITLKENPYSPDKRSLKFMELRLAGGLTPTLIDTGSEFTIMNWSVAQYPQLKTLRRRLKEYWSVQGSIGKFSPTTKVRLKRFRGGQKFWEDKDVIIMDFDSLDVLGVNDQPFIIAGMNLFADTSFYMDFKANELMFKPEPKASFRSSNSITSYRSDGSVIRDE